MKKASKGTLLLAVLIAVMLVSILNPLGMTPKVYDKAGLFSKSELQELEEKTAALAEKLQLDIAVVTIKENEGKTSRAYADDFYDANGFGYGEEADGLLLLINMEDREVYISTCGLAIKYFTDLRINSVLDQIYNDLADGKFSTAVNTFLSQVEYYVGEGIPSDQYTQMENSNAPISSTPESSSGYSSSSNAAEAHKLSREEKVLYSLLFSLTVAGIAVGVMAMMNRSSYSVNQKTYLDAGGFAVIDRQDIHVDTRLTYVVIQKDSNTNRPGPSSTSGSGRSTVHHSSSGRVHGGGGRKF